MSEKPDIAKLINAKEAYMFLRVADLEDIDSLDALSAFIGARAETPDIHDRRFRSYRINI